MLERHLPCADRMLAVPLAGQLAHESCVRPGPLVLGTAFLRFPTAAPDRDRTVSRAFPRITAGADYTFTLFPGAGVLWRTERSRPAAQCHLFAEQAKKSLQGHSCPCYADV